MKANSSSIKIDAGVSRKVALFLPSVEGGGAERIMVNLAGGFVERGIETDLVLARADGPYLSQVPAGVNVVDLGASRTLSSLPKLLSYLKTREPEGIISALDYANLVAVWAKYLSRKPVNVIVTIHNQITIPRSEPPGLKERLIQHLLRPFYPLANAIVAVSEGVANDASTTMGFKRDRIKTIYNPVVSDELFKKAAMDPGEPWFGEDQPPVLVAIGRFYEQKDFPTLVRAFALVRQEIDCRLIILGEGPGRSELEKLADTLRVRNDLALPGFVNNPYAYLQRAAAFVLSSKWEGLPTVLIEALALGKAIVSTDCKSGPEEILQAGKYGKLVPVGDEKALAAAIAQTLCACPPSYDAREASRPFTKESAVDAYLQTLGIATN